MPNSSMGTVVEQTGKFAWHLSGCQVNSIQHRKGRPFYVLISIKMRTQDILLLVVFGGRFIGSVSSSGLSTSKVIIRFMGFNWQLNF